MVVGITILVVSTIVSAVTGFFVYVRNSKQIVNKIYGLLTVSLILFSITNYLSLETIDRLFYIRLVIFFATIVVSSLYYLVICLETPRRELSLWQVVGVYATVLVAGLDLTPLVFSGLSNSPNPVPVPGFGATLFVAHTVVFLAASCTLLGRHAYQTKGSQRLQYVYMFIGILPMFLLAPVTGIIFPVVLKNDSLIFLSPAYGVFFVCFVGYAIVRHRLFDIRFFVVRAVAYISTLFLLSLVFVTPILLILGRLLKVNLQIWQFILAVPLSAAALYLFQYLRQFFDKLTGRVFFRYYYDPQDVLDQLSGILVRTADVDMLRRDTAQVLQSALKPTSLEYKLFAGHSGKKAGLAERIAAHSLAGGPDIIDADDPGMNDAHIATILRNADVALAIKLRTTHEDLGFMVLGHKQSGEAYLDRDKRLLSVAADEIAISLQNALRFQEIQQFNLTLQQKVDEATRRLRQTNQKLLALDEAKDDFISMASHQLRTPLTSVKGYLSMVIEGDAGKLNSQQARMLRQAFSSSQRMVYLITDLLNISRLKTGKFVIEPVPADLSELAHEEVLGLLETAKLKGITLTYQKPASFPKLMLDEVKTRQVIMNFVDNAIYYTPTGGHIRVELEEKPAAVELRVVDDGMGVPKSEQHHLFTKFYRAANARRARPDGTGLGLFMAKKVVTAQGGSIVFSSREGHGSTFGFVFSKTRLRVPERPDVKRTAATIPK